MRRALALAIAQGKGRDAGVLYNNLALAVWLYEGPQAALAACDEGMEFCERRGHATGGLSAERLTFLAEGGEAGKALSGAEALVDRLSAGSNLPALIEANSIRLRMLAQRGEGEPVAADAESLAGSVRGGHSEDIVLGFAAAAQVLVARGSPERSLAVLIELDELAGTRDNSYYVSLLPELVRTALAVGGAGLAHRLVEGVGPTTPLAEYALCTCRGQLAEAAGKLAEAAITYAEAAERWRAFGNVPERAFALLGQGRCLTALGKPEAEAPLREARELFASMGYKPALTETDELLAAVPAA